MNITIEAITGIGYIFIAYTSREEVPYEREDTYTKLLQD